MLWFFKVKLHTIKVYQNKSTKSQVFFIYFSYKTKKSLEADKKNKEGWVFAEGTNGERRRLRAYLI